jgi:hypothetical protein
MNKSKNNFNNKLSTISEDKYQNDDEKKDNLFIELTYYPDTLPAIKSYYIMTKAEYSDLQGIHMDLYIDNFLNDETLTRDKLDIHIINNKINQNKLKEFIDIYGNPFDIITLINSKQNNNHTNKTKPVNYEAKLAELLVSEFSDSDSEKNNISEPIFKPKSKTIDLKSSSESDSDDYINTVTEIIETFNKSQKVDGEKLEKLTKLKPELLKDNIINEIVNK